YETTVVSQKTGIPVWTCRHIRRKAKERGFDPQKDPRILEHYVEDGYRPGRPKEITQEVENQILQSVRQDRAGREKSSEVLAYEADISSTSALRILRKNGLSNVKPTRKPGLTAAQRASRLQWALAHRDWTLEDWKVS